MHTHNINSDNNSATICLLFTTRMIQIFLDECNALQYALGARALAIQLCEALRRGPNSMLCVLLCSFPPPMHARVGPCTMHLVQLGQQCGWHCLPTPLQVIKAPDGSILYAQPDYQFTVRRLHAGRRDGQQFFSSVLLKSMSETINSCSCLAPSSFVEPRVSLLF
jgi:hypothetical protein